MLEVDFLCRDLYSLAMQCSRIPLVQDLTLRNTGTDPIKDLEVELQVRPDLGDPLRVELDTLHGGESLSLLQLEAIDTNPNEEQRAVEGRSLAFPLSTYHVQRVVEDEPVELHCTIKSGSERVKQLVRPFKLLAYNTYRFPHRDITARLVLDDPSRVDRAETYACFVTPNHPAVAEVLKEVSKTLEAEHQSGALEGYQSQENLEDIERVASLIEALYLTLGKFEIRYIDPAAGGWNTGQRIRFPDHVLSDTKGTCADLAPLAASCLEQMGLQPVLVLVHGHVVQGAFLNEVTSNNYSSVIEDVNIVRQLISSRQLLLFDSSSYVRRPQPDFADACATAIQDLNKFNILINIHSARKKKFTPLPIRAKSVLNHPAETSTLAKELLDRMARRIANAGNGAGPITPVPSQSIDQVIQKRFSSWKEQLLDLSSSANRLLSLEKRDFPSLQSQKIAFVCADLLTDLASAEAEPGENIDAHRFRIERWLTVADYLRNNTRSLVDGNFQLISQFDDAAYIYSLRGVLEDWVVNKLINAVRELPEEALKQANAPINELLQKARQDLMYLQIPEDLLGRFENLISVGKEFQLSGVAGVTSGAGVEQTAEELMEGISRVMPALGLPIDAPQWNYEVGRRLAREARRAEAESGFSPLYLALGLLQWREKPKTKGQNAAFLPPPLLAPLVLYPIELRVDSRQQRLTLVRTEGSPIGNATLVERLRKDFDLDLSILNDLPEDEHGVDLEAVLVQAAKAIQGQPGWHVIRTGVIAPFSFNEFLLWRDLHDNEAKLLESEAVRQIASAGRDRLNDPIEDPAQLDLDRISAKELPLVLPGDSTQIAAILAALKGRSFVLQGPPGTGKSQTITNLIATAMAAGKTVLFVAKKKEAIDVVWKRLAATGLAHFCLALDANTSNSQQVAASLGEALDHRRRQPDQWEEHCVELDQLHQQLHQYRDALHRQRDIGHSLYEMLDASLQSTTFIQLPEELQIESLNAEQFRQNQKQLREFIQQRDLQGDVDANPWHFARLESCGIGVENQLRTLLTQCHESVQKLHDQLSGMQFRGLLLPEPSWDLAESLGTILQRHPENRVPEVVSEPQRWLPFRQQAEQWLKGEVEDSKTRLRLQESWHDDVLAEDVSNSIQRLQRILRSFIVLRWIQAFFFRRHLSSHLRQRDRSLRQILEDLRAVQSLQTEQQTRIHVKQQLQEQLESWDGSPASLEAMLHSWGGLASLAEEEPQYQPLLKQLAGVPSDVCAQLLGVFKDAHIKLAELAEILKSSPLPLAEHRKVALGDLADWLQSLRTNLQRLPSWSSWIRQESEFRSTDLAPLLDWAKDNNVPISELETTYRLGVLQHWFQISFDHEARLNGYDLTIFNSDQHEAVQQKYRERQPNFYKLNQEIVQSRVAASIPHGAFSLVGSELTVLSVERSKQKRWLPLRTFFQKIPTLLPKLKPCVLASPGAVARFLPADGHRFDIAIFDEASQLATHQAIGAMGRAKQVIVVGDEKQMPPPQSDRSRTSENEDELFNTSQAAQLESILSEAIAYGFPQQMLRWHYRSCHESLIEFSNRNYYGNRLHLFPAAQRVDPHKGVHWHPVPGGRSRSETGFKDPVNRREAETVCSFLIEQLRRYDINNEKHPCFGVITFNNIQRDLISQLMREARRQEPAINSWFETDEPMLTGRICFIENLESIQGDERDVILLTLGYGLNENNQYPRTYGLLHRDGGERRLNVAITRARQAVHVFSSLDPQGMRDSCIGANYDGVRHLQDYLQFCRDYDARSHRRERTNDFDGELQHQIYEVLIEAGCRVDCKIGSAGYRIDLAVVDPDDPTSYLIGIETDGLGYASAASVRDRDLARHEALIGLGWKLHRVWSVAWLRNREREKQRLLEAVRKAMEAPRDRPVAPPSANPALPTVATAVPSLPSVSPTGGAPSRMVAASSSTPTPPPPPPPLQLTGRHLGRPYQAATLEPVSDDFSTYYREQAPALISARLLALLAVEAPITVADATRRVAACWGGKNLTQRAQNRLLECVRPLEQAQQLFLDPDDVLWLSQQQRDQWQGFRRPPQAGRSLDSVPPVEMRAALGTITRAALSIDADSLLREASKSLTGAPNFTEQRRRVLQGQLDQLLACGQLETRDGRIFAVEAG